MEREREIPKEERWREKERYLRKKDGERESTCK